MSGNAHLDEIERIIETMELEGMSSVGERLRVIVQGIVAGGGDSDDEYEPAEAGAESAAATGTGDTMSTRILRTPDICGGEPRVEGTRWPTKTVLSFLEEGYTPTGIKNHYPHLTLDQINAAIRYEMSWHRRLGRLAWWLRYWIAAKALGMDVETLREEL